MFAPLMIAALLVGYQEAERAPWVTVVSREGQFVVDFPTEPTNTSVKNSKGPGGLTKFIAVSCETPEVDYIAQKLVSPTSVVKGAEAQMLDDYREFFALIYNGKVISEKIVRYAGGLPGRDFTIRGRPEGTRVIVTIRVRMYLSGNSIFALLAIAAANRELPVDTGRFFGSFTVGTTKLKKSGPKPEVAGTEIKGWGSAIDPDGDCKITTEGKTLTINIPGALHDLNADIDKFNAPRVLRQVRGDFDVQVKVAGDFKPGPKSTNPKSVPYNGAGIFVWRDSDNFIRLERGAIMRNGKLSTFAEFEEREGGTSGALHNGSLAPGVAYLRLVRKGVKISGFVSKDGKRWTALRPIDTVWPAELKIGVNAVNSSNEPFTVRFEEFSFKGKSLTGSS